MNTLDIKRLEGAAMFAVCTVATVWVALTDSIPASLELVRAILITGLFFLIRHLFMKKIPSPTGSGAIVMGIGIFINGAIVHFSLINKEFVQPLTLVLFLLLLFIAGSYIKDMVSGRIFKVHFANPLGSFAVGTWIAGTSVCGIALCQRIPEWKPVAQILVIGNISLWLYFVYRAVGNFYQFFTSESWQKVHGVLLLSTVSTQSLVIVWKAAFGTSVFYRLAAPWMILVGVCFYLVSFYLIVRRYAFEGKKINLDKGWFNTNCIIHGAMSITGLASAVCGVVSANLILLIWLWVLLWFVMVEIIEIIRAVKRIRLYGFADALLVYDPTQWSRNFTFGMMYAFTLNFDILESVAADSFLLVLHKAILAYFAWIVLILLLLEILVFFRDRLSPVAPAPSSIP
ncbi:hypothetical protein [Desulforhopalus sp. IMCC35007]|uniref:hypothetical protein n=1 Tax=Desulforhopalus sp. IMCC35007 TaxID=2569543 RepID=UPI0010AE2B5C|nr:hypothetical protein [Desulforhopalus sp. IMCC35007]TKB05631.1 hypothetical protein FCL48_24155 [Desulforhopalus sp. IMCC35007]